MADLPQKDLFSIWTVSGALTSGVFEQCDRAMYLCLTEASAEGCLRDFDGFGFQIFIDADLVDGTRSGIVNRVKHPFKPGRWGRLLGCKFIILKDQWKGKTKLEIKDLLRENYTQAFMSLLDYADKKKRVIDRERLISVWNETMRRFEKLC